MIKVPLAGNLARLLSFTFISVQWAVTLYLWIVREQQRWFFIGSKIPVSLLKIISSNDLFLRLFYNFTSNMNRYPLIKSLLPTKLK